MTFFFLFRDYLPNFIIFIPRPIEEIHALFSETDLTNIVIFYEVSWLISWFLFQEHLRISKSLPPLPSPFDEFPFKIIVISLSSFGEFQNFSLKIIREIFLFSRDGLSKWTIFSQNPIDEIQIFFQNLLACIGNACCKWC